MESESLRMNLKQFTIKILLIYQIEQLIILQFQYAALDNIQIYYQDNLNSYYLIPIYYIIINPKIVKIFVE